MKRIISAILCLLLIFSALTTLTACKKEKEYKARGKTISYTYFNTVSALYTYGDTTEEQFNLYCEEATAMLGYYHKLFDIYYDYAGVTNIRRINQKAGIEPVKVDKELVDFLLYCKELFTLTDGKTNVMMGAVLKIWHNYREDADFDPSSASVPTREELEQASRHTDIDLLVIDEENLTVYISDPAASLDVGAVGKGYATERVYERLVELGADSTVLNFGGNIRTIGVKPTGEDWLTGLTNPDKTSSDFAAQFYFGETACVTSGNYERYYTVDGVRYHHIIDPDTLMPAAYFASVTILTADSALADALSTALFCISYAEGVALLEGIDADVDVIWIDNDGNIASTKGVKFAD